MSNDIETNRQEKPTPDLDKVEMGGNHDSMGTPLLEGGAEVFVEEHPQHGGIVSD